MHNSLQT